MSAPQIRSKLTRWRAARHVVLGTIVLAGSLATSAAVMHRLGTAKCGTYQEIESAETFSGIGVVIEAPHEAEGRVVVTRVLPGAPAEGKLFAGAHLISVDGEVPSTLADWAARIKGEPGTSVELEVAYPCGGHRSVTITRDVLRVEY